MVDLGAGDHTHFPAPPSVCPVPGLARTVGVAGFFEVLKLGDILHGAVQEAGVPEEFLMGPVIAGEAPDQVLSR